MDSLINSSWAIVATRLLRSLIVGLTWLTVGISHGNVRTPRVLSLRICGYDWLGNATQCYDGFRVLLRSAHLSRRQSEEATCVQPFTT